MNRYAPVHWLYQTAALLAMTLIAVAVLCVLFDWPRDDTDPPASDAPRSGMQPHTDAATGCQYLSTPLGGITPRLDANGQHRGCRQ